MPPSRDRTDGVSSSAPGLGNPYEEGYYWPGYRDPGQGEKSPLKTVFNPECKPPAGSPRAQELDEFFCRMRQELNRSVIFSKRPANVEPPWFARPIIKAKNCLTIAPGATVAIFDRVINERQRAILTMIGQDVAPLLPLMNGDLVFWWALDGVIVPIYDDQSTGYCAVAQSGQTTVPFGAAAVPFCLFSNALSWRIIGRKRLTWNVENQGLVPVEIRGVMGWYEYWTSYGATEFENADVQL